MTMSYIVFVQPAVMSTTGMDFDAVLAATCLISAFSTLLMAFLANYPIALAPAMGHNFFFVFTVVGAMGFTWQVALGAVFISGVLFLAISLWGLREALVRAIPGSLKHGIAVGIGLLITLVGLEWGGFVASNPATLVTLGDLGAPAVWMSTAGLAVTMILLVRRQRGAILAGIFTSTALGLFLGVVRFEGVFASPPSIAPVALQLDIAGALSIGALPVIFIFFFLDLFDSIGSLIGIAHQGNFMKGEDLPRAREALMADAIGTTASGLIGNSTIVSYIESATGVAEGARTGSGEYSDGRHVPPRPVLCAARPDDRRRTYGCVGSDSVSDCCAGPDHRGRVHDAKCWTDLLGRSSRIHPGVYYDYRHSVHVFNHRRHRFRLDQLCALEPRIRTVPESALADLDIHGIVSGPIPCRWLMQPQSFSMAWCPKRPTGV